MVEMTDEKRESTDNRAEWEQHNCGPGHALPLGRCTVPSCVRLRTAVEKALDARTNEAVQLVFGRRGGCCEKCQERVTEIADCIRYAAEKRAGGEK